MTALYPHHRHLTPRLRVFIDWLMELFLANSPKDISTYPSLLALKVYGLIQDGAQGYPVLNALKPWMPTDLAGVGPFVRPLFRRVQSPPQQAACSTRLCVGNRFRTYHAYSLLN